ncbi:MAG: ABC transporter ATP-binding protein [Acidobacteriota bacterium]
MSLAFDDNPVLEDVDLTLKPQDFVGLIGPNGAGKTVLLKVILGLLKPDRGRVSVFGEPADEHHGEIAWVPQFAHFETDFPIRVVDVVTMGTLKRANMMRRPTPQARARIEAAMQQVDLLEVAHQQVGRLSGGQVQRVLIARALAQEARILLLDEPAASLDSRFGEDLFELLARLSQERAVLLVSHDIGVLHHYVTSVACLNRRLTFHGSREVTKEMLEATYGSHVDLVEHPFPHRILEPHEWQEDDPALHPESRGHTPHPARREDD